MKKMKNPDTYNMPLTLERHFHNLAQHYPNVQDLYSLWRLLKKRIEDKLTHSRGVFVNYSLHDGSHSRSILQIIERFLGEERIRQLSATDTFMLLVCTYVHDYGMAQTFNKIYDILGSKEFERFLEDMDKKQYFLEKEDRWAIHNLLGYLNKWKQEIPLNDMYLSIILVVQLYLRPEHWKGVIDIEKELYDLFQENVKQRFIHSSEGIVEICMCHGLPVESLLCVPVHANGMVGDEFHPRFVAVMLRFGDLLDWDNGRFPMWFVNEISKNQTIIPKLSLLHFRKHEAISHFLITPKKIEIIAKCDSEREGYEVAELISDWKEWLVKECREMVINWYEITQQGFGRPPGNVKVDILVDDRPYMAEDKKMQMQMSQERVMKLLEGTSIYRDRYVGIREMLQNAVDASLLQLWKDIIQNRYVSFELTKDKVSSGLDLLDLCKKDRASVFDNYNIYVEVILDKREDKVFIIVKDKGIGITPEDMEYISNIGSSKERKMYEKIPAWLQPSGVFGIGLQSVFQLTDCIDFYTRRHNVPEQKISLYSYGVNRGKISVRELPPNEDGMYSDNSIPGTNVKISVEPTKILNGDAGSGKKGFIYYDPEFDKGEKLDMVFAEVAHACEHKIKEFKYDYFNIFFKAFKTEKDGTILDESEPRCLRRSFFYPEKEKGKRAGKKPAFGETLDTFPNEADSPYRFIENMAYYWDKDAYRCYRLSVRPCLLKEKAGVTQVFLPKRVFNPYDINYKFNKISNAESIYALKSQKKYLHADFLNMSLLILDNQPTNYLNIDRDRLRERAIDEEELLVVRKKILRYWCEHFCGTEVNKDRFKTKLGILISLTLLFYQNVDPELFRKFVKLYCESEEFKKMVLGEEKIPVAELWEPGRLFSVSVPVLSKHESSEDGSERKEAAKMFLKTARHLPSRLIHITSILYKKDAGLVYCFFLRTQEKEVESISMNDVSRLYDYMKAFDAYKNQPGRVDYSSVLKKVFKPDKQYENLLLPRHPYTFGKGRNFEFILDECITWYILSPFDKETCRILRKGIEKEEDVLNELLKAVQASRQLEKCVRYIMKIRFTSCSDWEKTEKGIRDEYTRFVETFYNILHKNREMVNNQFRKMNDDQEF